MLGGPSDSLDQGEAIRYSQTGTGRDEVTILNGKKPLPLEVTDDFLFLKQEVRVILPDKILKGNPSFSSETEKEGLQPELFDRQVLLLFYGQFSLFNVGEVLVERSMIPPTFPVLEGMSRRAETEIGSMIPVFLIML